MEWRKPIKEELPESLQGVPMYCKMDENLERPNFRQALLTEKSDPMLSPECSPQSSPRHATQFLGDETDNLWRENGQCIDAPRHRWCQCQKLLTECLDLKLESFSSSSECLDLKLESFSSSSSDSGLDGDFMEGRMNFDQMIDDMLIQMQNHSNELPSSRGRVENTIHQRQEEVNSLLEKHLLQDDQDWFKSSLLEKHLLQDDQFWSKNNLLEKHLMQDEEDWSKDSLELPVVPIKEECLDLEEEDIEQYIQNDWHAGGEHNYAAEFRAPDPPKASPSRKRAASTSKGRPPKKGRKSVEVDVPAVVPIVPAPNPATMGGYGTVPSKVALTVNGASHRSSSKQLAKGGRKPKDGACHRNAAKREQHMLAERERRKKHKDTFQKMVSTMISIDKQCYSEYNNRQSKKNNLQVAMKMVNRLRNQHAIEKKNLIAHVERLYKSAHGPHKDYLHKVLKDLDR